MLGKIFKTATKLDEQGHYKSADFLDQLAYSFLLKLALKYDDGSKSLSELSDSQKKELSDLRKKLEDNISNKSIFNRVLPSLPEGFDIEKFLEEDKKEGPSEVAVDIETKKEEEIISPENKSDAEPKKEEQSKKTKKVKQKSISVLTEQKPSEQALEPEEYETVLDQKEEQPNLSELPSSKEEVDIIEKQEEAEKEEEQAEEETISADVMFEKMFGGVDDFIRKLSSKEASEESFKENQLESIRKLARNLESSLKDLARVQVQKKDVVESAAKDFLEYIVTLDKTFLSTEKNRELLVLSIVNYAEKLSAGFGKRFDSNNLEIVLDKRLSAISNVMDKSAPRKAVPASDKKETSAPPTSTVVKKEVEDKKEQVTEKKKEPVSDKKPVDAPKKQEQDVSKNDIDTYLNISYKVNGEDNEEGRKSLLIYARKTPAITSLIDFINSNRNTKDVQGVWKKSVNLLKKLSDKYGELEDLNKKDLNYSEFLIMMKKKHNEMGKRISLLNGKPDLSVSLILSMLSELLTIEINIGKK